MTRAILTLNAGSSSLKVGAFAATEERLLAAVLVDRIGEAGTLRVKDGAGVERASMSLTAEIHDHHAALTTSLEWLAHALRELRVEAVGHRVVHGGPLHARPIVLDASGIAGLEAFIPLAPLHQPHNLAGIRAAFAAFPKAVQVACFDTAFHRAHPFVNDVFALPRDYYDKGIRRYGFHGLSYEFIAGEMKRRVPLLAEGRVVIAHLGNGASICAIHGGRSIASTMGFSALDGLPMGTRCGQLDPGVVLYLMEHEGMDARALSDLLYRRSGLLGLSGLSNDMRTLEAAGTQEADQAIDYFVFRVQREIGAMAASLGGIDALVFCGGIGENSRRVRARICERLAWMGIELDAGRNAANAEVISRELTRTSVLVIPTNEELVIARAARELVFGSARSAA
jgi:acetate kinase